MENENPNSMPEMGPNPQPADSGQQPNPGSSKKKIFMIIGVLVVVLAGVYFVFGSTGSIFQGRLIRGLSVTQEECKHLANVSEKKKIDPSQQKKADFCQSKYPLLWASGAPSEVECKSVAKLNTMGLVTVKGLNSKAQYCAETYSEVWGLDYNDAVTEDCLDYEKLAQEGKIQEKGYEMEYQYCQSLKAKQEQDAAEEEALKKKNPQELSEDDCKHIAKLEAMSLITSKGLQKSAKSCVEKYPDVWFKNSKPDSDEESTAKVPEKLCEKIAKLKAMNLVTAKGYEVEAVACANDYPEIWNKDYSEDVKSDCAHYLKLEEQQLITKKGLQAEAVYCSINEPQIWGQ